MPKVSDLFVIGGGVNGCGIARDAIGRGLSVTLAEMNDIGGATSSASTKLFHGGLRYLEYFEFRLVREALIEREILLKNMPHISWPMRFILPLSSEMRFDNTTPTSRLLARVLPWLRGRRPDWLIRLGLFLYDHMGGRQILPATRTMTLAGTREGAPLKDKFVKAYEYSDCWVEDSRLVALNARDAQMRGAQILTRTKVISAEVKDGIWHILTQDVQTGVQCTYLARMLVNAAGPWVGDVIKSALRQNTNDAVRLVRGSHIVTKRIYDHEKCYFFQGQDGRIIFAIPYETDFTLIGTTDADHLDPSIAPVCSAQEQAYLLNFANAYFKTTLTDNDIVWRYSGVRPLFDEGAENASSASRDYTLKLDRSLGAPVLNVFGGKITTYRRLANSALDQIQAELSHDGTPWTHDAALPGGAFPVTEVDQQIDRLRETYPFLDNAWAKRLIRAYGTDAHKVLGDARSAQELGLSFGVSLSEREVRWLMTHEFARTADDVLWRRSKLGLRLSQVQRDELAAWMKHAKTDHAA